MGNALAAAIIYGLDMVIIAIMSIGSCYKAYQALMLIAVLQTASSAMPELFGERYYTYLLIYIPMLIPVYLTYKRSKFSRSELGITIKGIHYYLPLGLVAGAMLGGIEYLILPPAIYLPYLTDVIPKLVLLVSLLVGFVEEFIFRSMLQTALEEQLGITKGLFIAGLLFGLTYSGYGMVEEIIFGLFAGLVLGILFQKTRSLPLIALAHGAANITLLIVIPALLRYLHL